MRGALEQAFPATAMRMSIDKGYFMWEVEAMNVATSRVQKLNDDHVVGNTEDAIEDLKSVLKLKPENVVKMNQMLSAMSVLNNCDDANSSVHVLLDRKVIMKMKSIHYQGPNYEFIHLSVSNVCPWKNHLEETSIDLAKQIDKDNSGLSGSELFNENGKFVLLCLGFQVMEFVNVHMKG